MTQAFEVFCAKYAEYQDETLDCSFLEAGILDSERGNAIYVSLTCSPAVAQQFKDSINANESLQSQLLQLGLRTVSPVPEQVHFLAEGKSEIPCPPHLCVLDISVCLYRTG